MPRHHLKKRADGRYCCRYQDMFFYGATERECYANRDEYKKSHSEGLQTEGMTVRQYVGKWLPVHKASVGDKTYNDYAKQLDVLVEFVGSKMISQVKPLDIKEIYNHYLGYSASTIHRAQMLYKAVFDSAVEDGYCRTNPCKSDKAKPHKGSIGSHRAITDEEERLILNVDHRFRTAALIMRYAGLRRGEVLALDIDRDVDFESGWIHVGQAVRYESNQPIVDDPKTQAGIRDVPLFPELKEELQGKHGLVLTSVYGKQCSQVAFRNAMKSYLKELSKQAGHEVKIRCHDFRHTYCTMLRDAGVEMKLAMRWMGHADEKMILRIYDHITEKRVEKAVENVKNWLSCSQNGSQNVCKIQRSQ